MSRLIDAISWDGQTVSLILVGLWPHGTQPQLSAPTGVTAPDEIRRYELEDSQGFTPDFHCVELDLVFSSLPDDVEQVVNAWLRVAVDSGATLTWFAFEGSFDFEHLLTPDVADQVFGVADAVGVSTALDDAHREGEAWTTRLAEARNVAGLLPRSE
jgi:hypothetical protein